MKKRLVGYTTLGILVIGVLVAYKCFFPVSGVNLISHSRIAPGMTPAEVEELIGVGDARLVFRQGLPIRVPNQNFVEHWKGELGTITVFYANGVVAETEWSWNQNDPVERLLSFFGRLYPPRKIRE